RSPALFLFSRGNLNRIKQRLGVVLPAAKARDPRLRRWVALKCCKLPGGGRSWAICLAGRAFANSNSHDVRAPQSLVPLYHHGQAAGFDLPIQEGNASDERVGPLLPGSNERLAMFVADERDRASRVELEFSFCQ